MDDKALLFSLMFLVPLMFFFIFNIKRKAYGKLPPGPFAWPIIGNIFQIDPKKPHISMARLAQSYGPIMTMRLGSRLAIVASSPEAAREVYKIHDKVLSGRYVPLESQYIPDSQSSVIAISGQCNESWRFLRGIIHTSLFSPKALESHSSIRVEKVKEMLDFLGSKDGQLVNFTDVTYATIVNTWTRLFVSQDIIPSWEEVGESRKNTRNLVEFVMPGLIDLFPALSYFLKFSGKQKVQNMQETKRELWGDILGKRRGKRESCKIENRDYLDVLINNSFNDNQIANHFIELLSTAETVAIAVEWAMAELIRNQEALTKLSKELENATEGGVLQERHLTKLPYLQACIKEALRLHPPTPIFLPHKALQSCQVMNYEIPKDCLVIVNLYALATDPNAWKDPVSFKPERFLGKDVDVKGTNYEVLPFGAGRRICSGYSLALQEMQLLLAASVHAFDWSLPSGKDSAKLDMTEYFGTTLGLENPLQIIPKTKNELKIQTY